MKRVATDQDNRLVVTDGQRQATLDGLFSVDAHNQLVYQIKEPEALRRQWQLPEQRVFAGTWRLNKTHDLELVLRQAGAGTDEEILTLRGEVVSLSAEAFAFSLKTRNRRGQSTVSLLVLEGTLGSDQSNRLFFRLSQQGQPGVLTCEGNWRLNRSQQIEYVYRRSDSRRKVAATHTFIVSGVWEIASATRLRYLLTHGSGRYLEFRVQLESPSLYPQKGVIKYRLGIGSRGPSRRSGRLLCLYGDWKLSRSLGVTFDMEYGKVGVHRLCFDARISFNSRTQVLASLSSTKGEATGIRLVYLRRMMRPKDAEFFIELRRGQQERAIEAGVRIPF